MGLLRRHRRVGRIRAARLPVVLLLLDEQGEQRRGRAKRAARDAVLPRPASIRILRAADSLGHLRAPVLPLLSAALVHALGDVHVAKEFLATVVAETGD